MAVLEKIRQRNILLSIIILLPLAIFIITMAGGNTGQEIWNQIKNFTGGNAALKVGDQSLNIQEFDREYADFNTLMGEQNQQKDGAAVRAQFVQQKTMEMILMDECEQLGITTSKAEMTKYTVGDTPLQPVVDFANQLGVDPQTLNKTFKNPPAELKNSQEFAELRHKWELIQDQLDKGIRQQKVAMLAQGMIQPSALELAQLAEDNGTIFDVELARKDYSSEDDKNYKVTDKEINDAYAQYKSLFKITEPQRLIHYIVVDVVPSGKDIAAADKRVATAFKNLADTTGLMGVRGFSDLVVEEITVTNADVRNDSALAKVIAGGVGTAMQAPKSGFTYKMYKQLGSYTAPDSITFDVLSVRGDKVLRDSVLAKLNGGVAPATVAQTYKDNVQYGGAQGPLRPQQLDDSTRVKMLGAIDKYIVINEQGENAVIAKITDKKADKTFFKVGRVSYTCDPSELTADSLRMNLQKYIGTNKTLKAFENEDAAKKMGLTVQENVVAASQAQLGNGYMGIENSFSAIKWAFDNKPGTISPIMDIDNNKKMIVVAVDEVYDGEFLPATNPNVKQFLTDRVMADKKGDALIKRYDKKASDIAGYAKLMDVQVDTVQVSFGGSNMGVEPGLVGRICGSKATGLQPLFKGEQAVYAYAVKGNHKSERTLSNDELKQMYNQQRNIDLQQAFLTSRKVKNNTLEYYQ